MKTALTIVMVAIATTLCAQQRAEDSAQFVPVTAKQIKAQWVAKLSIEPSVDNPQYFQIIRANHVRISEIQAGKWDADAEITAAQRNVERLNALGRNKEAARYKQLITQILREVEQAKVQAAAEAQAAAEDRAEEEAAEEAARIAHQRLIDQAIRNGWEQHIRGMRH